MKRMFVVLLGCLLLLPGFLTENQAAAAVLKPLPYHLVLDWSSQLANPYYVLAGPSDSYGRFPFNDWARQALQQRLQLRSGPASAPRVTVVVQLQKLTTGYDEVGAAPEFGRIQYAGLGRLPSILGDDFDDGGGPPMPEDIYKSAHLTGELRLERAGKVVLTKPLSVEVREHINWQDFDAWSYDYGSVLKQVAATLVGDVDQDLVKALGKA